MYGEKTNIKRIQRALKLFPSLKKVDWIKTRGCTLKSSNERKLIFQRTYIVTFYYYKVSSGKSRREKKPFDCSHIKLFNWLLEVKFLKATVGFNVLTEIEISGTLDLIFNTAENGFHKVLYVNIYRTVYILGRRLGQACLVYHVQDKIVFL